MISLLPSSPSSHLQNLLILYSCIIIPFQSNTTIEALLSSSSSTSSQTLLKQTLPTFCSTHHRHRHVRTSSFLGRRNVLRSTFQQQSSRRRQQRQQTSKTLTMLRNFDLPEAIIFYGTETVIDSSSNVLQPGVQRLLEEVNDQSQSTVAILLSESRTAQDVRDILNGTEESHLTICSSLDMKGDEFWGDGVGHCPSPAALLDAISIVEIQPRGFGGSSGFGMKNPDPQRSPLPKHCVVFVTGPNPQSRSRCSAARAAGMRVLYIETDGLGTCDAEDLVDGVVSSLGEEDTDWDVVTLDAISTPGDYWLNPPNPRDDLGNRVFAEDVVNWYKRERMGGGTTIGGSGTTVKGSDLEEGLGDDDISEILADIDPL